MICRILFLLFISSSAGFDVNVAQIKYHGKEKQNVTLEWTFTTNSSSSLNKTFVSCDLITDDKSYNFYQFIDGKEVLDSQHERFSGRVQSDKDALREGRIKLHVSRLRTNDSGLYVCDVKTNLGRGSAVTHLKVTPIPPLPMNVTQTHYQAEENHNVTLEWTFNNTNTRPKDINIFCEQLTKEKSSVLYVVLAGKEKPEHVDKRFSGRVQSDRDALREGRIRLHVSRLRTDDSGRYRCEVMTGSGSGSNYTDLNVTAEAPRPTKRPTERPTERPTPSPQPEPRRWTGLIIAGVIGGVVLASICVSCFICSILRRCSSNSQGVRNSRTPLFGTFSS